MEITLERVERLRCIGNRGGKEVLRGMTLDAVAALARRQYNMSYGALMGFVHETGHLPEGGKSDEKDAGHSPEL